MPSGHQQSRETEEVRWVSDRTKLSVGIASALAICASIIASTWTLRGYVSDFKADISDHFSKIENSQAKLAGDIATANAALAARWSLGQMQSWSVQLDRANRGVLRSDGATGLNVPDPSTVPQRP